MEMEDVIVSMVGKDRFVIFVSIIKYIKSGIVMDMIMILLMFLID